LLSIASAALLSWVFFGSYSKPLELIGFVALVAASVWDFCVKKRACTCKK
jgi:threonine/homoserine efflux transporter RhtA